MTLEALDTRAVRRWKRYARYSVTSAAWVGELPCEWKLVRLKHVSRFRYGDALPADVREDGTVPVYGSNGKVGSHAASNVRGPALVIGRKGSYGKATYVDCDCFVIDTAYFVNAATTKADLRWLSYMMPLLGLDESSQDSAIPGLSREFAYSQWVPLPPLSEQRAIAAFLDRETARIDELIGHNERLIALLEEKRQALISHAVTRGLDPAAPLKGSGVPWIGMVPKHWSVEPLKHGMTKVEQGWSPQCENRTVEFGEWGVLKVGCVNSGVYDESECKALPADMPPIPELVIHAGDVLMSRSNTVELVGMTGIVHKTQGRILLCDKLYRLGIRRSRLDPEFAVYLLRSACSRAQIEPLATGASSSMRNISADIVQNLVFAFPPLEEQRAIAQFVEAVWGALDRCQAGIRGGVQRLQEYRTALISAAVTGQIDVRGEV